MLSLTQGGHSWEERYNSKGKCQGLWDRGGTPNALQTGSGRHPRGGAGFLLPWLSFILLGTGEGRAGGV